MVGIKRIGKSVTWCEVLYLYSLRECGKPRKNALGYLLSGLRFESGIFGIESMRTVNFSSTFVVHWRFVG
jgi:hypothetical protein